MVVTEMPRSARSLPSRRSSRVELGPVLARPSERRMTRLMRLLEKYSRNLAGAHIDAGVERRAAARLDGFDFFLQRGLVLDVLRGNNHPRLVAENDQ